MPKMAEKKRPIRVTVVAILNIIIGLVYLIVGFFFESLFPYAFKDPFWSLNVLRITRVLLAGMGIFLFLQAYGFWHGKGWTKILSVSLIFVCMFLAVLPLGEKEPYIPPIMDFMWFLQFLLLGLVYVIFFIYLNKPHVKSFFDKT